MTSLRSSLVSLRTSASVRADWSKLTFLIALKYSGKDVEPLRRDTVGDTSSTISFDTRCGWKTDTTQCHLQIYRKKACLIVLYTVWIHKGIFTINSPYRHTLFSPRKTNTRNSNDIRYDLPHHCKQYRKTLFSPQTVAEWNSLPHDVISLTNQILLSSDSDATFTHHIYLSHPPPPSTLPT